MVLPVAIAILFFTVLLVRESGEFESVLEYVIIILIFGVFYLLVVPIVSIWFTGRALIKNTESDDRDMDMVKVLKLFEHIGEALPQLVLSCIFIASNGGPWVCIICHWTALYILIEQSKYNDRSMASTQHRPFSQP